MKSIKPSPFFLTDQEDEVMFDQELLVKSERLRPRFRRGIYLLPNSLTTAGLFAGFYAIVAAMRGNFDLSAISIFIAMIRRLYFLVW